MDIKCNIGLQSNFSHYQASTSGVLTRLLRGQSLISATVTRPHGVTGAAVDVGFTSRCAVCVFLTIASCQAWLPHLVYYISNDLELLGVALMAVMTDQCVLITG